MTRKLAIMGKGTGGALSAAHFYRHTDWEIDWYYDPNTPTQAVGEGGNLSMPTHLWDYFNFYHHNLHELDGTFKSGIYKEGWGKTNKDFFHEFHPPLISYHFSALKIQNYILNKIKDDKRVKIIEKNVDHNIDCDFIMDCSGKPKTADKMLVPEYIPVNSVYVTQCFWDYPQFQYTLTIAKEHGWVFGIPLQNRCSIGYLYNSNVSTLEQVKEDVKEIFSRFNLTPSDTTNAFTFGNYYRKNNFEDRVCYNGNASFFLEPLEATSFSTITRVNRLAWDLWNNEKEYSIESQNTEFHDIIKQIQNMIMLHYYSGSKYSSDFWELATKRGEECLSKNILTDKEFRNVIARALYNIDENALCTIDVLEAIRNVSQSKDYGTWGELSYFLNIKGLGITKKLQKIFANKIT